MTIDNEQQAQAAIDSWRSEPLRAQLRYLQEASDSLELSLMYYEQKDNPQGQARASHCLALLQNRRAEVESALAPAVTGS